MDFLTFFCPRNDYDNNTTSEIISKKFSKVIYLIADVFESEGIIKDENLNN